MEANVIQLLQYTLTKPGGELQMKEEHLDQSSGKPKAAGAKDASGEADISSSTTVDLHGGESYDNGMTTTPSSRGGREAGGNLLPVGSLTGFNKPLPRTGRATVVQEQQMNPRPHRVQAA